MDKNLDWLITQVEKSYAYAEANAYEALDIPPATL